MLDINRDDFPAALEKIDNRVADDLRRYVDGPLRERIRSAKQNAAFWLATQSAVRDAS